MKRLLITLTFVLYLCDPTRGNQGIDGVWEGEIQDPRRPVVVTVDFTASHVAFSGGAPAGMKRPAPTSDENTVKFDLLNGQQTLRFTGVRAGARISGEVDTGSRRIPFWVERLPSLPAPANRNEAWRQDIDVVLTRFLRYDRSFGESQREAARARLQKLRAAVDRLSDAAITVELARAVALSGNAHTRL
jgi:hypothetical protein